MSSIMLNISRIELVSYCNSRKVIKSELTVLFAAMNSTAIVIDVNVATLWSQITRGRLDKRGSGWTIR